MAITGPPIGRVLNVFTAASGVPLALNQYRAVTFVSFVATGDQVLTLTQHTADAAGAPGTESNLAIITTAYKAPAVGGVWAEVTQAASHQITHADATNDQLAFTVRADQVADGTVFVECTAGSGILTAILHDPVRQLGPAELDSPLAM